MTRPLTILAGVACLAFTASASAFEVEDTQKSQTFNFSPAQLLTEEGVNDVRRSLRMNAHQVCQPNDIRNLHERRQASLCADRAYAEALQQLDAKITLARMSERRFASNATAPQHDSES